MPGTGLRGTLPPWHGLTEKSLTASSCEVITGEESISAVVGNVLVRLALMGNISHAFTVLTHLM